VTGDEKNSRTRTGILRHTSHVTRRTSGFTLAEVLAAMLFLAIVVPVAVEALHVSSLAGEVAARKGSASRIADRVLNESLVMTNWSSGQQSGVISEGALDFNWTLVSETWPPDSLQSTVISPVQNMSQGSLVMLTAKVDFLAQGRDYSVSLSTLAGSTQQAQPATTTGLQF
jgi:Tfp pilus assembly protein PilV